MKKLAIVLSLTGLDLLIKQFVDKYFKEGEGYTLLPFFRIQKLYNQGVAFSILNGQSLFIIFVTILAVIFLFKFYREATIKEEKFTVYLILLILAGAIGNLIDRVFYGHVIDYLRFDFGTYVFPIFNLADVYITCGIILLVINVIKEENKDENEKNN